VCLLDDGGERKESREETEPRKKEKGQGRVAAHTEKETHRKGF